MSNPAICPPFTEEHEELRQGVRRWVADEITPNVAEWEKAKWVPAALFKRMAELGYNGMSYPTELGGQGGTILHEAVVAQELSRASSGGIAAALGAPMTIATPPILKFGNEEQHDKWVRPFLAKGEVAALAITEPGGGTDVAGLQTTATKVDGGWKVNGEKCYITGGVRAKRYVTAVKTTQEGGHGGISFLVIERGPEPEGIQDDPIALGADRGDGISASELDKLGWRASDTALVKFNDVFVPDENLLGELHGGFKMIMANFAWERLSMAIGAVSAMEELINQTIEFTKERPMFGTNLSSFQGTRWAIAEMATTAAQCKALTNDTLRRHLAGEMVIREVAMTKLATQRALVQVADKCLQLHGGAGYLTEQGIEMALRDARLGPIGGGTDEIMKDVIGRTYSI